MVAFDREESGGYVTDLVQTMKTRYILARHICEQKNQINLIRQMHIYTVVTKMSIYVS